MKPWLSLTERAALHGSSLGTKANEDDGDMVRGRIAKGGNFRVRTFPDIKKGGEATRQQQPTLAAM